MEYKIKTLDETDPRNSMIEMHGKPIEFTIHGMQASIKNAEKNITELEAQATVNRAKMTNIETNHPFVLDMSEQDMFTCHMYQESKALAIVSEKKADEFKEAFETDKKALADLLEKLPELKEAVEKFDAEAEKPAEEVKSDNN